MESIDEDKKKQADCYCELWDKNPDFCVEQGYKPGFCGTCEVCGEPGHTRAHPSAPSSGAWCDEHYEELSQSLPIGCSRFPQLGVTGLVIYFLYHLITQG